MATGNDGNRRAALRLRQAAMWPGIFLATFGALSLLARLAFAILNFKPSFAIVRLVVFNATILQSAIAALLVVALVPSGQRTVDFLRQHIWLPLSAGLIPTAVTLLALVATPDQISALRLPLRLPLLQSATGLATLAPHICFDQQFGESGAVSHCTNAQGFRGPQDLAATVSGARRVTLVGDSFVFGAGVPDAKTLPVQLQRALQDAPTPGVWQVDNLGMIGAAFASYVRLLEKRVPMDKPDVVVLGFLKGNDVDANDLWERQLRYGPRFYLLAEALRMGRELWDLDQTNWQAWAQDETRIPAASRARFDADLDRLLALQQRYGFRLLVYSYFGPTLLFQRGEARGQLAVLSPPVNWSEDPRLHIVGDGHPTAEGNALFAQQLAQVLAR